MEESMSLARQVAAGKPGLQTMTGQAGSLTYR